MRVNGLDEDFLGKMASGCDTDDWFNPFLYHYAEEITSVGCKPRGRVFKAEFGSTMANQ